MSVSRWQLVRFFCCAVLCLASSLAVAQTGAKDGEWRYHGGDPGQTKYSALDQINRDNIKDVKVLWTCAGPDAMAEARVPGGGRAENNAIFANGVLYNSSPYGVLAAINPTNGEKIWAFDPEGYKLPGGSGGGGGRPANLGYVHRGFSYWTDGTQERLFILTHNAYLNSIDAKTGKLDESFGEGGRVNLAKAIPRARAFSSYTMSSPPVVCRDNVICGSSISDGPQNKEAPRGDIQAFDVRTGKPSWIFHSVPQEGEFGVDTWENDAWKYTGNTNVWTVFAVDDELGYVYCPFGTPTNDWYGGARLGNNLFGESLVCLDAKTGKRVWHFQTVHHGVWDYDLPGSPVMCDITVDGKKIKAVAQLTKTGFTFVFDRTNGNPVWPIEERPVPASKVPGERLSPTQPHPTKPAPYERQGSTEDNVVDYTPAIKAAALEILNRYDHGPLFEPPSERGTINLPGWGGGGNWWGAAFDVETGIYYIPSSTGPIVVKLNKPDAARSNFDFVRGGGGLGGGLPGPNGLPLFKGPYARITAINLNTGDHAWQVAHGDGPRARHSQIAGFDVGPLGSGGGGPMVTKTMLFVAQGNAGRQVADDGTSASVLRAWDKKTGEVIRAIGLPSTPCSGSPITFMAKGKQYVVVVLAGGGMCALGLPN